MSSKSFKDEIKPDDLEGNILFQNKLIIILDNFLIF